MTSKHSNDLYRIQCAFESQQQIVCDCVLEHKILEFNDHTFFSPDWNALAYICNETSTAVTRIVFNNCNLDVVGAEVFVEKTREDKTDCIKSLCFSPKTFNKDQRDIFQLLLGKFQFLTEIGLENTEIGPEEILILIDQLTLSRLHYIGFCMPSSGAQFLSCKSTDQLLQEMSSKMSCLEEIRYSYNELSNELHKKCLILLLKHFKCKIRLDCNKITCRGTTALSQLIKKCTSLTHLSLSCNLIGSDGAITISNSLLPSSKLLELDLEGNDVGDEGALALVEAADKVQDNFILKLGNRHISHETCERIQKLSNSVEIREESSIQVSKFVNLSHPSSAQRVMPCFEHLLVLNFSGKRISKSAFEELVNGLEHCRCLHTLNLSRCSLRETHALFSKFQNFTNLKHLNLSGNYLNEDSFTFSFEDRILSKSLKVLDLSYNNLYNDGIECVAYYFRNIQIEILNLSNNRIGAYGAAALARWLRIGKRIYTFKEDDISHKYYILLNHFLQKSLNIHMRRNGSDGKSYADEGHQLSSSLLELNLSGNKLGDEGAAALGYGLRYCQNLQSLNLNYTGLSYGIEVLLMGLKECHALQSLNLDGNFLPLHTENCENFPSQFNI